MLDLSHAIAFGAGALFAVAIIVGFIAWLINSAPTGTPELDV